MIARALVPIFFVLLVGYAAGRTGRIDRMRVAELNVLVMDFLIPAALLLATASTTWALLAGHARFLVAMLAGMVALYAAIFALARRVLGLGQGEAAVLALVGAFPNLASIGLPLTDTLFGQHALVLDAIAIAAGAIVVSPLTLVLLERAGGSRADGASGGGAGEALLRALTRPVVLAPVFGLLLSAAGIGLPPLASASLRLLGVGAGGVSLFVTGVILSAQPFRLGPGVAAVVLAKNALHPALAALLATLLGLAATDRRAAIVLSAVPCGFFGILFGLRYGVVSPLASSSLLLSTALGSVSVALVLLLA